MTEAARAADPKAIEPWQATIPDSGFPPPRAFDMSLGRSALAEVVADECPDERRLDQERTAS